MEAYEPDRSLRGKLRRRVVRLIERRPATQALEAPLVSFSFDDAPATAATTGARLLEERGVRGTYYLSAGLARQDSPMGPILGQEDAERLHAAGHEIGCHTFSHMDLGQAESGLAAADVVRNAAAVRAWTGATPVTFAYPYGDVAAGTKRTLAPRFRLLRALHHGLVARGADLNQAPAVGIEGPDGEAIAMGWLEAAVRRKAWLILYTHDVCEQPSQWGCTPQSLERLADAAAKAGCRVVTVAEGARLAA